MGYNELLSQTTHGLIYYWIVLENNVYHIMEM